MTGMIDTARRAAGEAARSAALGLAAALLGIVGLGFLTFAAYVALRAAEGVIFAASVIGLAYLAAAVLLAVLARRRPQVPAPPPAQPVVPPGGMALPLAEAFAMGLGAGRAFRR